MARQAEAIAAPFVGETAEERRGERLGAGRRDSRTQCANGIALAYRRSDSPAKRKTPLSDDEIHAIASRVRREGLHASSDVAMLYLLLGTGAKPLELAGIRVCDLLQPSGQFRPEGIIPAESAISGTQRSVFLRSAVILESLADYVRYRLKHGHSVGRKRAYRGLDPASPFFLDANGNSFNVEVTGPRGARRRLCRGTLEACKRISRLAKLPGLCVTTLRVTLIMRLHSRGASRSQIIALLGLRDPKALTDLVDISATDRAGLLGNLAIALGIASRGVPTAFSHKPSEPAAVLLMQVAGSIGISRSEHVELLLRNGQIPAGELFDELYPLKSATA